jgi:molecular chaperone DnaK
VITIDGSEYSPVDVSAIILRHLKAMAESRMEMPLTRAVITVPAYFNDSQRVATREAAEKAGLEVERILAEPTAAALSFGLDKAEESARVAVFDLGGGTFDISVLEMREGLFQVLATCGDTRLGGDDFDHLLARQIHQKQPLPGMAPGDFSSLPARHRQAFLQAARKAKHLLSESESATIPLGLPDGETMTCELQRGDFENALAPWMRRITRHCWQALTDARTEPAGVDHVILVGGSSRLPLVRKTVADLFGKEPNLAENPDESIARGAVVQAGMLSGALRSFLLLDVTPLSLGIETFGGLMNVIIPRNTTIPAKAGEMFTNAVPGQESMLVRILQGEREMARDNWELGQVTIPFSPGPKGSARVGVQFSIDANGILSILARDTRSGTETNLTIQDAAVNVDDAAVEAMVSGSIEHAFADMNERRWTEAAAKGRELIDAVSSLPEEIWQRIPQAEMQSILEQATALRTTLSGPPGDAAGLSSLVHALDEATQNLAVLLMESAVEDG